MRHSGWRSCAVVVITAAALAGNGTSAAGLPVPVPAGVHVTMATGGSPTYSAAGALFTDDGHFCSGSVVASPAGDLVLTAAHCVQDGGQGLSFAPAYRDGVAPYGMWTVTDVFVPDGWRTGADPDLDFAFVTVRQDGNPEPVQKLTGAEKLGTDRGFTNDVTLVGYPDDAQSAVVCRNTTTRAATYQQEIACPGFPDGTSGGPWLTDVGPGTGNGTVIGVIGGYQQGGDTPDLSYSAYFDQDIQQLYETAAR